MPKERLTRAPRVTRQRSGSERPRGSRSAPARDQRLDQLITAAEDIFLDKGYHAATMAEVAAAAAMSKKTVYQIIDSKSDLFTILLDRNQEKLLLPSPGPDCSVSDTLTEILLYLGEFMLAPRHIAISRLILTEYSRGRKFGRELHRRCVQKALTLLAHRLAEFGPPLLPGSSEAKDVAAMLFGMSLAEFHLGVVIGFLPKPSATALRQRIRHAVQIFLEGYPLGHNPGAARPVIARSGSKPPARAL